MVYIADVPFNPDVDGLCIRISRSIRFLYSLACLLALRFAGCFRFLFTYAVPRCYRDSVLHV